jgi:glutamate racemase
LARSSQAVQQTKHWRSKTRMNKITPVKSSSNEHLGGSGSAGKIGIFDSGLGGLVIAKAIFNKLPGYDYVYLGDTLRVPYGNKSSTQVYKYTSAAIKYLFGHDCQLVILACNTASALALRKIQREFLPKYFPDRRVLGVVIPTLEEADKNHKRKIVGVIGTSATIRSHIYKKELMKIDRGAKIFEMAAPKLVPLIEQNSLQIAEKTLKLYLDSLLKHNIEALVLGCTHYPILQRQIRKLAGKNVKVVSQTDFLPGKLKDYLKRHPEIESKLSKRHRRSFLVTKDNQSFDNVAKRLFGRKLKFEVVDLLG